MIKYIWLKEIREELYTWKSTVWLLIASLLFSFTSYLLLTDKELSLLDQTELMWLLGKIIIGVGLLIVAIDTSSILTREFEKDTAESLLLTPVSLQKTIAGKLLASMTLWFFVYLVAAPYIIVASAGSKLILPFLGYVLLLGTLGVLGFSLFILGISLLFRSSKNTMSTSLIILLTMTIPALFSSTLKNNPVADFVSKINPIDNIFSSLDNVLVDYQTNLLQNWQFIVPIILFCLLTLIILIAGIHQYKRKGIVTN